MADLANKQRNFVVRSISAAENMIAAADALSDIKREWIELQYGGLSWADVFDGDIQHLALVDLVGLADVETAVVALMNDGARADLLRFRK